MPGGGSKPGERRGGRKRGSPNKTTQARQAAMQKAAERLAGAVPDAFDGDAHSLLVMLYKDPTQPTHVRLDAARAALPFEKPRLATATEPLRSNGHISHEEALREMLRQVRERQQEKASAAERAPTPAAEPRKTQH